MVFPLRKTIRFLFYDSRILIKSEKNFIFHISFNYNYYLVSDLIFLSNLCLKKIENRINFIEIGKEAAAYIHRKGEVNNSKERRDKKGEGGGVEG